MLDFKKYLVLVLVMIFGLSIVNGQTSKYSKVLGKPADFEHPYDNDAFYLTKISRRMRAPWVVFCDRSTEDRVTTYTSAGGREKKDKLKYKDHYYVVEEREEWVHLIKGVVGSNLKIREGTAIEFGWINKKNVLLWNSALVDYRTNIHHKSFIVDDVSNAIKWIRLDKEKRLKVYKGPYTIETILKGKIGELYFVYKKENDRYLLCKQVAVAPGNMIENNLIGWVNFTRLNDWNTRLALEPNFEKEAFSERKDNEQFRMLAYGLETSASIRIKKDSIIQSDVFWDNDPVGISSDKLAKTNPRRFKGNVVRFPVFNISHDYIRSGVFGKITWNALETYLKRNKLENSFDFEFLSNLDVEEISYTDIAAGEFSSGIFSLLFDDDAPQNNRGWTNENLKELLTSNHSFYSSVFIPNSIPNTKYSSYKPVLMLSREEIEIYLQRLNPIQLSTMGTPNKQRQVLYNTMVDLLRKDTGDYKLEPKNETISNIRSTILGLSVEEAEPFLHGKVNFKIKDIKSSNKIPDRTISSFIQKIGDNTRKLKNILRDGMNHEFAYIGQENIPTETVFFWLPLEYFF